MTGGAMYVGAGIILARRGAGGEHQFLVLKGRKSGIWSFSKGHPEREDHESPLRTAARETFEETGLEAGFHYRIFGNSVRFGKRPYWMGLCMTEVDVVISRREHSAYAWLTRDEIAALRGNSDVRAWIQKSRSGEFSRLLTISSSC
jgi:8-oxo-dGTP pyrophosphatase MutT (NUDIX family)